MAFWVGGEDFCDYATIQEAVEESERRSPEQPETIYLLPGVYREQVAVYRSRLSIVGIGQVEIRMDRHAREKGEDGEEIGTFATPTLFLGGSELLLENITVSNTAGQGKEIGQAIALTAHCDRAIFRFCTFKGYQDTLFTGPLPPSPRERASFGGIEIRERHPRYRQLYLNCRIEGTVDYVFGGAAAYFERCQLHSLLRTGAADKAEETGYVTAASTPEGQPFGYVFSDCVLTAETLVPEGSVYLGRPWREHARTVFVGCRMGKHIHPAGWHDWNKPANRQTSDYREYGSKGSDLPTGRVPWALCGTADTESWSKESVFADDWFWKTQKE